MTITLEKIKEMNLQVGDKIELDIDTSVLDDLGFIPGNTEKYKEMGYFKKIICNREQEGFKYKFGMLVYTNGKENIETIIPCIKEIKILEYKK
ncbi:MAG: hypothetical protein WC812_03105 [Candidatus Pacearchaeota archaeon]|jgi:hypothetical protein